MVTISASQSDLRERRENYFAALHNFDFLKAVVQGLSHRSDVSLEERTRIEKEFEEIQKTLHVEAIALGLVTVH